MTHRTSLARLALGAAALVAAVPAALAQQRPAARPLGAALATSEPFGALSAVRPLPGGRVLVNDPAGRRVLLLDSSLKLLKVVADSTPSTATAYGSRPGGLLAYRGDSTLFVDPASLSMLVIDPSGTIARVMAAPRPGDVSFLAGGPLGNPGFDARGRLIYRTLTRNVRGLAGTEPGQQPAQPDTTPLVRFDLASRMLDTAAFIRIPPLRMNVVQNERGVSMTSVVNPLPVVDDWAVLPDGSVAILRGREYRLDVLGPDGKLASGEKIAFDWQRLTDEDKARIVDSTRKVMEASRAAGTGGMVITGGGPAGGGGGMEVTTMRVVMGGPGGPGGAAPLSGAAPTPPPLTFVEPGELPDYRPAFGGGSMRADTEGRVWVRTIPTKPLAGGPEYDVIDRGGKLVERVAVPRGTTIVGFGDGGIVYLGVRDASGTRLVRARVK
jgi:hypothetical protein